MVLGQHEAAQLRPEMTIDAGRHRRHDGSAIGRHPALAPEPDRRRLDDQVLDDEVLVALEAGALRNLGLDDPILDRDPRQVSGQFAGFGNGSSHHLLMEWQPVRFRPFEP